jgi:hypothetical protein
MGMLLGIPGMIGQVAQAQSTAGQALQNAHMADAAARDAIARGTKVEAKAQEQGAQVEGAATAAEGASNVVTSSGSAKDVMADTSYFTDINVKRAMDDAARESWGYQAKAGQYRTQAENATTGAGLAIANYALGGLAGGGGSTGNSGNPFGG